MRNILSALVIMVCFGACNEDGTPGKFVVNGELKNAADQRIYLEQVYFSERNPEVLDTADVKNGKFVLTGNAAEEGLFRLRLEKQEAGYIFINDNAEINFRADINDMSLQGPDFGTSANRAFKAFLTGIDSRQKNMDRLSRETDSLTQLKVNDSLLKEKIIVLNNGAGDFKRYIIATVDSAADPVVAMFALGYTRGIDPADLKMPVMHLSQRFPAHKGIAGIISQYNQMMAKKEAPAVAPPPTASSAAIGSVAPAIIMNDTSGKTFSLSSLRGKYVLVDFWASWCAPCRAENPNVVANYKKFKNKNFTVLGVSLDEKKSAWTNAIIKDSLSWKQISDLKGWGNAAVGTYGFEGIPFNVLLDPEGKIIAKELREDQLGKKLAEVLK